MFQEELRSRANNTKKDHNSNSINNNELLLSDEEERIYLTQELDQARRELTKFRKEMDGLSAQLNDMASEMVFSIFKQLIFFSCFSPVKKTNIRLILVLRLVFMQND